MTAALILCFYLLQFFLIIFILLFYIFSRRKFLLYSMENSIAEINFTNQLSWNNFHRTTYNLAISLFHRSIQWKQFLYCTTFSHSNCSSPVNFTGQKVRKFKNLEYVRVLVRISFRQTKHTLRKTFFFYICYHSSFVGLQQLLVPWLLQLPSMPRRCPLQQFSEIQLHSRTESCSRNIATKQNESSKSCKKYLR